MDKGNANIRAIYNFIEAYVGEHHISPTFKEIGAGVGLKSTSSIAYYLREMQRRGLVEYGESCSRTLRIIGPLPPEKSREEEGIEFHRPMADGGASAMDSSYIVGGEMI